MSSDKLDKDESELLASYDAGEWHSVTEVQSETARYREAARATFRKDRRVNIRISSKDLIGLQKRAIVEGIPYQTLIASVLHKYVTGRLSDKPQRITGRSTRTSRKRAAG